MVSQTVIKNANLFAWTASDMSGVSPYIITHCLLVYKKAQPSPKEKKRKMGEEKHNVAQNETHKLMKIDFMNTTWLENVVMVKKLNDKWRMCTDYTDINKACPKDVYPFFEHRSPS